MVHSAQTFRREFSGTHAKRDPSPEKALLAYYTLVAGKRFIPVAKPIVSSYFCLKYMAASLYVAGTSALPVSQPTRVRL
jgi:hypothetical protein